MKSGQEEGFGDTSCGGRREAEWRINTAPGGLKLPKMGEGRVCC